MATSTPPPVLSCKAISVQYPGDSDQTVKDVSFSVRRGEILGIFGPNACGKSTTAKALTGELGTTRGGVFHNGTPMPTFVFMPSLLTLSLYALPVAMMAVWSLGDKYVSDVGERPLSPRSRSMMTLCVLSVLFIVCIDCAFRWRRYQFLKADYDRGVIYVTSESHPSHLKLPRDVSIELVIAEGLVANGMPAAEAREKVHLLLTLCEFQMFDQVTGEATGNVREYLEKGVTLAMCSGGQKHLIYILRAICFKPQVLICDELLPGLSMNVKPKLLNLIRRCKIEGMAIIYFCADPMGIQFLAAERVLYMTGGSVTVEDSSVVNILRNGKTRELQAYAQEFARTKSI